MAWAAPRLAGHSTPVSLGQQRLVSREHGGAMSLPPQKDEKQKSKSATNHGNHGGITQKITEKIKD